LKNLRVLDFSWFNKESWMQSSQACLVLTVLCTQDLLLFFAPLLLDEGILVPTRILSGIAKMLRHG
jgi:hypothetical protein